MSDIYDGISLEFTVDSTKIVNLREDIERELKKKPIVIENISVSGDAINSIRAGIKKSFDNTPLSISNMRATNDGMIALRRSIKEKLAKQAVSLGNLKADKIDLKDVILTNSNALRTKIAEAINEGGYTVKITSVDAKEAIKSVKAQLNRALKDSGFVGGQVPTASSGKKQAQQIVENTVRHTQAGYLEQKTKELDDLKSSLAKSGLLKQSGTLRTKLSEVSEAVATITNNFQNMGAVANNTFRMVQVGIENDIAALNAMVSRSDNPVLQSLTGVADKSRKQISSGKNAITDTDSLTRLSSAWSDVQKEIVAATDAVVKFDNPSRVNEALSSLEKIIAEYTEIVSLVKELHGYGLSPTKSGDQGSRFGGFDVEALRSQRDEFISVRNSVSDLQKAWEKATKSGSKDIHLGSNFGDIEEKYERVISLQNAFNAAENPSDRKRYAAAILTECDAVERLIRDEQQLVMAAERASKASQRKSERDSAPASAKAVQNYATQLQSYLNANSSISRNNKTKSYNAELRGFLNQANDAIAGRTSLNKKELDDMIVKTKQVQQAIKALDASGKTLFERFSKGFTKFGGWMMITSALMEGVTLMHNAVDNVIELDTAMTQLRKVTDETNTTYEKFYETAAERSKAIGATLSDTINATADFARLGYNLTDSQKLAETALIYKSVGDGIASVDDSAQSIISTLKAFYNEADAGMNQVQAAEHIVDVFNELGNSFPIDSKGVGDALTRSAAALASANNTLEESAALAVGANAIVQDPERVGTALKTISMYLRSAKVEAQESGLEIDSMSSSTSKLRDTVLTLTGNKVDIMEDPNTLKSTYTILQEISKVWDDISDIDRAALLESLSGKRLANVTAAILSNFDMAEEALETAKNSTGSAMVENEKQMESVEGRIRQMKSAFEDFSNTILSSGLFKFVINGITGALNLTTSLMKEFGRLPVTLSAVTAAWKAYNAVREHSVRVREGTNVSLRDRISNARSTLNTAEGGPFGTSGSRITFDKESDALKGLTKTLDTVRIKFGQLKSAAGSTFGSIISSTKTQIAETARLQKEMNKVSVEIANAKNKESAASKRSELRGLYDEYKTVNPAAAETSKGAYYDMYTGKGTQIKEAVPVWTKIRSLVAATRQQMIGLSVSEKIATAGAVGLNVSFAAMGAALKSVLMTAGQIAAAFAIGYLIQAVVSGISDFVNRYKNAAEEALNTADATRQIAAETREAGKSVDDVIDKYEEAGKRASMFATENAENRAVLVDLQKQLTDSVGNQANNIDLVNGKYDVQINKLEKLKKKQNELQNESYTNAIGADINSAEANYKAYGSKSFDTITFDNNDKSARKTWNFLRKSDYAKYFTFEDNYVKPFFGGEGVDSTIDQLRLVNKLLKELRENGVAPDDTIFSSLAAGANKLNSDLSESFKDAQEAIGVTIEGAAMEEPFEKGSEGLADYQTHLMKVVKSSSLVKAILGSGLKTQKDVNEAVKEFIRTNFPEEYAKQIKPMEEVAEITKNLFGGKKGSKTNFLADFSMEALQKQVENTFKGEELEIAYSLIMDKDKSFKNLDELKKAVQERLIYNTTSDAVADDLREKLGGVINDENNKSAVNSLKKLANTTGIKASDIQDFADKSAELADILNMDGVSAEFLAGVLQREFSNDNIGAGISSITNKSIDLNKALGGMEKALDQASKAKDRYDSAMSKGNSDTGFRSISDAFTKAYTAAQAGMTGSGSTDFWAGSEYIFGGDQLKEWGYDTQTIVNHLKEMAPLLSNADSAGSGLAQKLMEMANDSGQIVINGENLGTAYTDQNGIYNIDIPVENFHKIADAMGVSDAAFTDAINAAKEWANVTTFSTNDVYNELRSVGDVLDNTSGAFKNFASAEIIDTKTLQQMGIAGADLEKFKRELESTGNNYVFLDLQTSAENAIKSLKDLGVAKEDAESGKLEINTKSLNTLLAGLEYSKEEVKSLYDALKQTTGMSDDDIAKAMENFGYQTENSAGAVEKVRNALESIKDKKVVLEIKTIMDGVAADPNSITARQPNMGAIKDFADSVYNVDQINTAMQTAASTIDQGFQNWFTNLENRRKELESLLDMSDVTVYSEDYAQTFRDQMQAAHDEANYYRSLGLDDTDDHIQKAKQKWHEGLQGLLAYDKQYYEQRKSLMDDVISQLEEDPFGDAASNADQIISAYQQIYEGAADAREKALAKGYPPNSEFIRSLEAEMRTAISKMEDTRRNAFKSLLSYGELNADIMERDRHDGQSTEEIAAIYSGLMSQVESEMSRVRSEGAAANNDYLMELTRQWYDYRDKVREAQKQVYQEQANWAKHLTTMQEYSLVGNSNKASMIGMYQNEQMALLGEISNLAAMGYSETDQEIYSLREQIAALNRSILEVQKELAMQPTEWAKHNTTMAQFRVNRGHADPREMISFYEQEQAALQSAIYQMSALGYSYTDQEIYSLVEQIEALNDSIMDANAAWVREQDQIWKVHEKELSNKHASPIEMMQYYGDMWRRAEENYYAMLRIGYGASTSEVQGYYNDYLDYIAKEQEAYKQAMQESIDVYGYYRKQLDVGKYPFEEYVRVINEEMDLVQNMTEKLREMGYHEESSEIVSLKTQYLQLIQDLKSEASKAISEVDRKFQHRLKMIEYQYGEAMTVELSLPVLDEQKSEYEKLLKQFRELGFADDTEEVSNVVEKLWEINEQRIQLFKRQMDDVLAVSEHTVSMIYDRQNYNYSEYLSEYTRIQAELHNTAEKYRAMGIDENDELIRNLQDKWWEYEDKIAAVFKKLVDDANAALESVKGAYDDFFAAAEDYAKYGTLTYDTFKSLLDLGPEYMAYLQNSNGALEMNKKTLKQVIAARAEELAVNTALNYVDELRRARQSDNFETINRMTKGITEAADATWGLVYANLELIDLTDTQYAGALKNINAYRSLTRQFALNIDTALNQENIKSIDDLTGSFDDFVGYVEDMIKAEHEDMKDALDDQLELYEDIVKKKKEALDLAKEEADYEQSVADQVKQIAKLQNQIDQLSLDTSREATAKRQKLEEDLASATRKLADEQSKHSLDATKDQLDADVDAMKQTTDKQKEAIDEETSSAEKLHRLAMDRIMQYANGNLDRLLDEVLDWNLKAGNSLERNIKDTWQDIVTLVERYGSLVGAIEAIRANSLKETVNSVVNGGGSSSSSTIGDAVVVDGGDKIRVGNKFYDEMTGSEMKEYAQSMIANAIDWWLAKAVNDKNRQDARAADNERIAKTFRDYGMGLNRTAEGKWMVSGAKNQLLFDNNDVGEYVRNIVRNNEAKAAMLGDDMYDVATKKDLQRKNANYMNALANYTGAQVQYRDGKWYYNGVLLENVGTFHKGGIAGNSSTLKQDEVMAKLQKGELILNKERQKGLFKLVDLASYLSEKLGVSLKKTNLSLSGGGITQDLGITPSKPTNQVNSNFSFAPSINVTISGGTDDPNSARRYAKQIADMTLGNLKDAFAQRGITKALAKA